MLEKIKGAYKEYCEKYNRKPDYIVLNHDLFHELMMEPSDGSSSTFMGMHPLVISHETCDFHMYEKIELDYVLAEYEKNTPKIEPYSVLRLNRIDIRRVNPNSNEKVPHQDLGEVIEIDYKTIRAYQRHLRVMEQGKCDS